MKLKAVFAAIGIVLIMGAGCASKNSAPPLDSPSAAKDGFVDRRTTPPPDAPENIPLPTEVHPEETEKSE
jgi:hypothetical protein